MDVLITRRKTFFFAFSTLTTQNDRGQLDFLWGSRHNTCVPSCRSPHVSAAPMPTTPWQNGGSGGGRTDPRAQHLHGLAQRTLPTGERESFVPAWPFLGLGPRMGRGGEERLPHVGTPEGRWDRQPPPGALHQRQVSDGPEGFI